MEIVVSNHNSKPLYEQIALQIKAAIMSGDLKAGEPIPSMRSLAKSLQISVLTVQKAYETLQADGFIETTAGKGCYVSVQNQDFYLEEQQKKIEEKLKDYLVENPNLFEEVMKKINGFTILNECDFSLSDYFVNNGGPVFIHLTLKEHPLGEIVHVLLKYKEKEISFDIPLLVKASLSLPKLESKLIYQIDQLIR